MSILLDEQCNTVCVSSADEYQLFRIAKGEKEYSESNFHVNEPRSSHFDLSDLTCESIDDKIPDFFDLQYFSDNERRGQNIFTSKSSRVWLNYLAARREWLLSLGELSDPEELSNVEASIDEIRFENYKSSQAFQLDKQISIKIKKLVQDLKSFRLEVIPDASES